MTVDPSAAPTPLRLDKEYNAFPLRDIDHEAMNNWCKREYLDRVKLGTDDPELLAIAINETIGMTWLGKGRIVANTVAGIHKLACLLVRGEVPYKVVATPQGIEEVTNVFLELHGGPEMADTDEGTVGNE